MVTLSGPRPTRSLCRPSRPGRLPVGPWPGPAWAASQARPSHPSHSACLGPLAQAGTDRRIRVAGLGGESGSAGRRKPVCPLQQ